MGEEKNPPRPFSLVPKSAEQKPVLREPERVTAAFIPEDITMTGWNADGFCFFEEKGVYSFSLWRGMGKLLGFGIQRKSGEILHNRQFLRGKHDTVLVEEVARRSNFKPPLTLAGKEKNDEDDCLVNATIYSASGKILRKLYSCSLRRGLEDEVALPDDEPFDSNDFWVMSSYDELTGILNKAFILLGEDARMVLEYDLPVEEEES